MDVPRCVVLGAVSGGGGWQEEHALCGGAWPEAEL